MGWLLQLQLQLLLLGSESSEEDVPLHQGDVLAPDDDDWDPTKDSDYEDAPKKKKQKKAASSSKKAGSSSSGKKKQKKRRSTSSDSESDEGDDVGAAGQQQPQSMEQEKVAKAAAAALRSIKSNINSQMSYKPSLKYGKSRVCLELPCLSESIVRTMLGPELSRKASNGKKQLQLKASKDDLGVMYDMEGWGGHVFCKTLRYGACLSLISGLTFTFNKESGILKVHGSYTMVK